MKNLFCPSFLPKNIKIKIFRTIILLVVLYGCETRSLAFKKGLRLKVLEKRVLRRIFRCKKDEVRGDWRRLHDKELYALNSSPLFG